MVNMVGKILFFFLFGFITINGQLIDPPNDSTQTILNIKPLKLYLDDDIPGVAALNEDKQTIADGFTQQSFELNVRQVNVVGNGDTWITSAAKLDTAFIVGLPAWNSAHLVFQDVTGKGQVPFVKNDLLFAQIASPSGLEFDTNGTALDNDALIRRFVYVVDSVDGLNVYTIPHTDTLTPANKGAPTFGDVFVKVGNISTGADLIKFEVDQADKDPRIEVYDNIKTWSDFMNQDKKIVVIGNIGGETTSLGTVADTVVGALFRGGVSGGNIILDNVDIKMSNQSSIQISGFSNDAGYTDDTAADNAQATADSKILTFYQASAPSTSSPEGSIWFDSDDLNSQYRLESSVWVEKVGVGSGIGTLIDNTGVYTGTVVASQIIAGTLTGFTIQTNASGQRVTINESGNNDIKFYNSTSGVASLTPSYDGGAQITVGGALYAPDGLATGDFLASSSISVGTIGSPELLLGGGGRIVKVDNKLASVNTGRVLRSDGVSYTPSWVDFSELTGTTGISATKIADGSVSNTEFQYLNGVTSTIQTQLNSKAATITGGATTIAYSNLTANHALVSDASGKVSSLSGVTQVIDVIEASTLLVHRFTFTKGILTDYVYDP